MNSFVKAAVLITSVQLETWLFPTFSVSVRVLMSIFVKVAVLETSLIWKLAFLVTFLFVILVWHPRFSLNGIKTYVP